VRFPCGVSRQRHGAREHRFAGFAVTGFAPDHMPISHAAAGVLLVESR
jgi:hypothetical protein